MQRLPLPGRLLRPAGIAALQPLARISARRLVSADESNWRRVPGYCLVSHVLMVCRSSSIRGLDHAGIHLRSERRTARPPHSYDLT